MGFMGVIVGGGARLGAKRIGTFLQSGGDFQKSFIAIFALDFHSPLGSFILALFRTIVFSFWVEFELGFNVLLLP
jgi:hypothetical protein